MWNRVEVTGECAEDATSNDCCCNEVDATDNSFHWKGQNEVWYVETFNTDSKHVAKYSDKITWSYWPSKEGHYALRSMETSYYR